MRIAKKAWAEDRERGLDLSFGEWLKRAEAAEAYDLISRVGGPDAILSGSYKQDPILAPYLREAVDENLADLLTILKRGISESGGDDEIVLGNWVHTQRDKIMGHLTPPTAGTQASAAPLDNNPPANDGGEGGDAA